MDGGVDGEIVGIRSSPAVTDYTLEAGDLLLGGSADRRIGHSGAGGVELEHGSAEAIGVWKRFLERLQQERVVQGLAIHDAVLRISHERSEGPIARDVVARFGDGARF